MRVGRRSETYPDDLGSRDHDALADRVPVKVTDVASEQAAAMRA
jgi:hypothetical protein